MMSFNGLAKLASATGICLLCTTLAMPIARADPLDGPRGAVQKARADSTCGPLNYNVDLENAAQQFARNDNNASELQWPGYTGGDIRLFDGYGDPQSAAIDGMLSGAGGFVRDCRFKDYGVGFVRVGERDTVSLALGEGLAFPKSATVVGKTDVYQNPKDATPDPGNGVVWTLGSLGDGTQVSLDTPCSNGFCQVIAKSVHGYVQQSHLKFN
jgi:hypothetical protein